MRSSRPASYYSMEPRPLLPGRDKDEYGEIVVPRAPKSSPSNTVHVDDPLKARCKSAKGIIIPPPKPKRGRNQTNSSLEALERPFNNDSGLCIPDLNRIEWNAFWAAGAKELFRKTTFHAIDFLEGEPLIKLHVDNRRQRKRQSLTSKKVSLGPTIPNATNQVRPVLKSSKPGQATLPERIRINAPAIIRAFSDICGEEISGPFLLFRPFRSLFYYEEEFRDLIKQQETMLQGIIP